MKHLSRYIIAVVAFLSVTATAQDYYDDIYGGARKSRPAKQKTVDYQTQDYAPADSYAPSGSLNMDVDTYNRRGQFLVSDSVASDTASMGDTFAYTRRIERFHNPEVVTESGDTTLCDYYYSSPAQSEVNIYLVDNSPYYPYSWAWRYGNPWYWNVYGPAYVGWGSWWGGWYAPFWYDPYPWGWSWGWTWTPGWGGWGPGWRPGWGPSVAWRPSTPGASRPHRPTTGSGMNSGRGYGNHYAGNTNRPGNMGRPLSGNNSFSGSTLRPGYTSTSSSSAVTARPGTRPNTSQGTYTPYGAGTRGRNSSGYGSSTRSSSHNNYNDSYRTPSNNNNSNRNSYRSSNSGSRSSYGGGYGGGSHSTRGGGGSGRSGGGGGSRGRR